MKRLFILTIILTCVESAIFSQIENLQEGNLRGNVRSLRTQHQKPITEKDSIIGIVPDDSDSFWFGGYADNMYIFDKKGRTIEFHTYLIDDTEDNATYNSYNKKGELVMQRFLADRKYLGKLSFEYDSLSRITKLIRYDEKGKVADIIHHLRDYKGPLPKEKGMENNIWMYNYNEKQQCVEEKCLLADGTLAFRHIFFYDSKGRHTQMISFDGENRQNAQTTYNYDSAGNICKLTRITVTKYTSMRFGYDKYNNEIYSLTQFWQLPYTGEPTGLEQSKTETSSDYRYDARGNWIWRLFRKNGTPLYIQKRVISYYPAAGGSLKK